MHACAPLCSQTFETLYSAALFACSYTYVLAIGCVTDRCMCVVYTARVCSGVCGSAVDDVGGALTLVDRCV